MTALLTIVLFCAPIAGIAYVADYCAQHPECRAARCARRILDNLMEQPNPEH